MLLSDDGNETLFRFVQSENASIPIRVTDDGIDTEVISVFPANAPVPIAVTVDEPTSDGIETLLSVPLYSLNTPPETLKTSAALVVGSAVVVTSWVVVSF